MKGVVLAGGTGTRLRPITFSMAKQLVPVGNKPILFYGLEDMAEAGITEVGIIISPETGDEVRRAVGDGSAFGVAVTYIVQDAPLGLAHALKTALPFVDGDDVLMYLGDNLVKDGIADVVADFERDRPNCQILLHEVDNPSEFGVAELDAAGRVERLVEKPKNPTSNLALVGVYLFDPGVEKAIDTIKPSARANSRSPTRSRSSSTPAARSGPARCGNGGRTPGRRPTSSTPTNWCSRIWKRTWPGS